MVELVTLEAAHWSRTPLKRSNERRFAIDIHHPFPQQLDGIVSARQVHNHRAVRFLRIRFTEPLEFSDRHAVLIADL